MSHVRPPAPVARLAVAAAVPPVVLLGWIVTTPVASRMHPVAMVAGLAVVAGWGARTGVLAIDRRGGPLRRGTLRIARAAGIVVAGGVVAWISTGAVPDGWPGVVPQLGVPVTLLFAAFLVARGIGRVCRRQADALASGAVHRAADAALPARALAGAAVAVVAQAVLVIVGRSGWPTRPWVPVLWVVVCAVAIVAVRPATLRARAAVAGGPSGRSWLRALAPLVVATALLTPVVASVLGSGTGLRLQIDLPDLSWIGDLVPQRDARPAAPVERERSFGGAAWLLPVLAAGALALLLASTRPARRRVLRPRGQRMPLSELLRLLLSALLGSTQRTAADAEPIEAMPTADDVALPGQLAAWMRRLRPRPRDPTAAILHDYAAVQRHLPANRRRRASETALVHAAREHDDALDELAVLVCAVRYAGVRPTSADADRSRLLARRVMRG